MAAQPTESSSPASGSISAEEPAGEPSDHLNGMEHIAATVAAAGTWASHTEITVFESADQRALTKTIILTPTGDDGASKHAEPMSRGRARRVAVRSLQELADALTNMPSHEALALGSVQLPAAIREFEVVVDRRLYKARAEARSANRDPDTII